MIEIHSKSQFNDLLKGDKKLIVDFYADWCGPCKMLAPLLSELEEEQDFELVKINVDNNQDLALEYNVSGIPYVLNMQNGKKVDEMVGFFGEDKVEEFVSK